MSVYNGLPFPFRCRVVNQYGAFVDKGLFSSFDDAKSFGERVSSDHSFGRKCRFTVDCCSLGRDGSVRVDRSYSYKRFKEGK